MVIAVTVILRRTDYGFRPCFVMIYEMREVGSEVSRSWKVKSLVLLSLYSWLLLTIEAEIFALPKE